MIHHTAVRVVSSNTCKSHATLFNVCGMDKTWLKVGIPRIPTMMTLDDVVWLCVTGTLFFRTQVVLKDISELVLFLAGGVAISRAMTDVLMLVIAGGEATSRYMLNIILWCFETTQVSLSSLSWVTKWVIKIIWVISAKCLCSVTSIFQIPMLNLDSNTGPRFP